MRARLFPLRVKQLELFGELPSESAERPTTSALLGRWNWQHPLFDFNQWFFQLGKAGFDRYLQYAGLRHAVSDFRDEFSILFLCRDVPADVHWAKMVKPHMESIFRQEIPLVTVREGESFETLLPRINEHKRPPGIEILKDIKDYCKPNNDIVWLEPCVRDLNGVTNLSLHLQSDKKFLSRIISVTTNPSFRHWLTEEEKFGSLENDFERRKLSLRTGVLSLFPTPSEDAETLSQRGKRVMELPPVWDKYQPLLWEAASEVRKRKRKKEPLREPLFQIK